MKATVTPKRSYSAPRYPTIHEIGAPDFARVPTRWRGIRALASTLTAFSMALGVALVVTVLVINGVVGKSFQQGAQALSKRDFAMAVWSDKALTAPEDEAYFGFVLD